MCDEDELGKYSAQEAALDQENEDDEEAREEYEEQCPWDVPAAERRVTHAGQRWSQQGSRLEELAQALPPHPTVAVSLCTAVWPAWSLPSSVPHSVLLARRESS